MKAIRNGVTASAVAVLLSACIDLSPAYQRPAAPVPASWPASGADAASAPAASAAQTGNLMAADIGWQTFFVDARLQRTIALALQNNRDLRVAILDIEKERAEYRIQRSALFPAIDLGAGEDAGRTPTSVRSAESSAASTTANAASGETTHIYSADLGFTSYELDLFGRVRNLSKAALETWLSTVETRRSTQITLVSEVASDWLTLASDKRLLAIAQDTFTSQQRTYDLVDREHTLGAASALDLAQAQASLQAARNAVAQATTTAAQARNALELVVGATVPAADLPDAQVDPVASMTSIPAGIPSTVLQRRPDVLAAEHTLKADNANVGAARANFFPTISLTAALGFESPALAQLFTGGNRSWSFEPNATLPIFDAGANRATLDAAKVTVKIDVANYEKTIQTAFEEVANALATRATIDEQLDAQTRTVQADQHAYDLSMAMYKAGSESLLDALTEQRLLYTAQQSLVATQLSAQSSLITLYAALGGGVDAATPQQGAAQ
ncbi:efflux transporter outer membrane subunit [Paraburkholderia acidisoli]|uniref:Efflux transporter outer membrane subunit n=1 Tax=Paraburkholderia acidisoli TaxID=2571748 RepID=A0A7Z2JGI6_9BURK|nr:efflux transporter outer membrane subunit [Paraburkholderia acidisoli]QGZ63053.1 efflux transporter outer membrane subunit [Paraburkholderia acidisoli]